MNKETIGKKIETYLKVAIVGALSYVAYDSLNTKIENLSEKVDDQQNAMHQILSEQYKTLDDRIAQLDEKMDMSDLERNAAMAAEAKSLHERMDQLGADMDKFFDKISSIHEANRIHQIIIHETEKTAGQEKNFDSNMARRKADVKLTLNANVENVKNELRKNHNSATIFDSKEDEIERAAAELNGTMNAQLLYKLSESVNVNTDSYLKVAQKLTSNKEMHEIVSKLAKTIVQMGDNLNQENDASDIESKLAQNVENRNPKNMDSDSVSELYGAVVAQDLYQIIGAINKNPETVLKLYDSVLSNLPRREQAVFTYGIYEVVNNLMNIMNENNAVVKKSGKSVKTTLQAGQEAADDYLLWDLDENGKAKEVALSKKRAEEKRGL